MGEAEAPPRRSTGALELCRPLGHWDLTQGQNCLLLWALEVEAEATLGQAKRSTFRKVPGFPGPARASPHCAGPSTDGVACRVVHGAARPPPCYLYRLCPHQSHGPMADPLVPARQWAWASSGE